MKKILPVVNLPQVYHCYELLNKVLRLQLWEKD